MCSSPILHIVYKFTPSAEALPDLYFFYLNIIVCKMGYEYPYNCYFV